MGFQLNTSVLNQKGSPAIYTDIFANRPPFGYAGRLFISNDTAAIYEDTGTAWVLIANVSSGAGTLQQVTTNGNTSNVGISVTAGGVSTNSATITSLTQGSVPFVGAAGLITQDNANLFFDDTNNRLGINTNTPSNNLDVHGTGTTALLALNNTSSNQSLISFLKNSTAKWRIGNSSTDTFDVLNVGLTTNAITISSASNSVSFLASIKIQQAAGFAGIAGFNGIGCDAGGFFFQIGTNTSNPYFNFIGLTAARTYTYPDATGTLALTSDLGAYLPLTGGTLTGTLNGAAITATGLLYANKAESNTLYTGAFFWTPGSYNFFNQKTDHSLVIGTYNSNNPVQALTIVQSGNILINQNTDDTVNKLQVTGSAIINGASLSLKAASTQPFLRIERTGTGVRSYYWGINGGSTLFLQDETSGNTRITLTSAGVFTLTGDVNVTGTFGTGALSGTSALFNTLAGVGSRTVLADASGNLSAPVSDILVKENIDTLKYGLETIMQLNAVQFEFIEGYKNYGEGLQIGAIAQEVEQIIPEAVFTTPSTGLKGIDYNQFNGIYIKAIQELNERIEFLLLRIELLENK